MAGQEEEDGGKELSQYGEEVVLSIRQQCVFHCLTKGDISWR